MRLGSSLDLLFHPGSHYNYDAHGVALDIYSVPEEGAACVNVSADASVAGKGIWGGANQI